MKLLFDENLSPKLPQLVVAVFPGSQHVRELGLKGHTDEEIWTYAGGLSLIWRHEQDILAFETSPESVLILS